MSKLSDDRLLDILADCTRRDLSELERARAVAKAAVQAERVTAGHWKQVAESLQAALEMRQRRDARQAEREWADTFTEQEWAGLLGGHMLPGDILCGEPLPKYLARKFAAHPPQASATVPEAMQIPPYPADACDVMYAEGWNSCRDAMLAASQPEAGKEGT